MPEILSPGVYVEEVPSLAQVTPGVTTSNMGIAGYAPRGPANVATLVQSYEQYSRIFGGLSAQSVMPLSLAAFFANGGRRSYVVRVPPSDATAADAKIQSKTYPTTVETGDGTTTAFTGTLSTAPSGGGVAGAAPLVPGTVALKWRGVGSALTAQVAKQADGTTNLALVPGQGSYTGQINPTTSGLPDVDLTQDRVVRGTVHVKFTTAAVGAVDITIPVGTGRIVEGSVGSGSNFAAAVVDHQTGKFSLRTLGTYAPAAAVAATLTTPAGAGATGLTVDTAGVAGNAFSLEFVDTGTGAGSLTNVGSVYTFAFQSGVTTVAQFEAAVTALPAGTAFGVTTPSATPATLLTTATSVFGPTLFSGGTAGDTGNITLDFTLATANKTAVDARGAITVVAGASLVDGETFTVTHGAVSVVFEFDNNGSTSGVAIPFTSALTATEVQAAVVAAINTQTSTLLLRAEAVSTDKVSLLPTTGQTLSVVLAETVTAGGFSVAPTTPVTVGIWTGDVTAGSVNYESGAYAFTASPAPHNKCTVVAEYTRNAWDLNPISVGNWGNSIRVQITGSPNYYDADTGVYSRFDVLVALAGATGEYGVVEQYEELVFDDTASSVYFADVINELSDYITVTEPAGDVAPTQLSGVGYTEVLGGGNAIAAGQTFSVTLHKENIQPRTLFISYTKTDGTTKVIYDDGDGNLIGQVDPAGLNTVDYSSGALDFKTLDLIKGGTLVTAVYSTAPAQAAHTEDFGNTAKNYAVGTEGTFDGTHWGRNQFTELTGLSADYKGIYAFNKVDEILQVVLPDFAGDVVITGDLLDYANIRATQPAGGDRFIILTTPAGLTAQKAVDWFRFSLKRYSKFAALYWPWVKVADPLIDGRPKTIPALAHIAGVYARTDNNRNVGKAPGGTVDGALNYLLGLETEPTIADRDVVYPNKINPLISSPQTGVAVWGVRTISNEAEWRYINARRLFMFLEKSVYNATWWAVFENNGPLLWTKLSSQIGGFLGSLFQQGYMAGTNPSQGYFVKCDGSNNTVETIEAGQVVIDIGVAPNRPAEFIRLRFQQKSLET